MEQSIRRFVIYGDVPSKKNSKQILFNRRTGRRFISTSEKYKEWHSGAMLQLLGKQPIDGEVELIQVYFYPSTARLFDLSNKFESIADLLVDARILKDDNYKVLGKIELGIGDVDKKNARAVIIINLK